MNPAAAKNCKPVPQRRPSGLFSSNADRVIDMVTNEVVAAIAAPRIGAWIWATPKRTMLSRAANRKAAVSGNSRSRVRQVLVAPRQESETMPETIEKCAEQVGDARALAKKGNGEQGGEKWRGVGQAGGYRRAEPVHAFEDEKARDAGNEDTDQHENKIGRYPEIDSVGKKQNVNPKKQRVNAEVRQQAAKVVERQHSAVDEDHRNGEPKRAKKSKQNGEHDFARPYPCDGATIGEA